MLAISCCDVTPLVPATRAVALARAAGCDAAAAAAPPLHAATPAATARRWAERLIVACTTPTDCAMSPLAAIQVYSQRAHAYAHTHSGARA